MGIAMTHYYTAREAEQTLFEYFSRKIYYFFKLLFLIAIFRF